MASPHPRKAAAVAAVLVAVFVHGLQASNLGLYWDDAVQLMVSLHQVEYDAAAFVARDTAAGLRAERPMTYIAFMITRAAFVIGLGSAHWALVGVFLLCVAMVARLARRVLEREWFVFAAGVTFAIYPLAPLQTIWLAEVHYHPSCMLALGSLFAVLRYIEGGAARCVLWLGIGALAYAASLLTHEGLAFVPPAFVALYALRARTKIGGAPFADADTAASVSRAVLATVGTLVATFGVYAVWRTFLLPLYGEESYGTIALTPLAVVRNTAVGAVTALFPWREVALFLYNTRPAPIWVACALTAGAATWLVSAWLCAREPTGAVEADDRRWAGAAAFGLALFVAALATLAVSPVPLRAVFGVSFSSRSNFVVTVGLALLLPALLFLAARRVRRAPLVALVTLLATLLWVGLVGVSGRGGLLSYRSHSPALLGRYSLGYGLLLLTYSVVMAAGAAAAIALTIRARRSRSPAPLLPRTTRHLAFGLFAGFVALGSLVHFSAKQQFVEAWRQQQTLMRTLREQAPGLLPSTFVVIVDDRGVSHPWATHDDVTSYLLAMYGDPSVMGNTLPHLRFHPDGFVSMYHKRARTFGLIPYDRVLLFEYASAALRPLSEYTVTTVVGEPLVVKSHPERIIEPAAVVPRIWRHINPSQGL